MEVNINSRLYTEGYTGVQSYIYNLFTNIKEIDTSSNYTFIQPEKIPKIGLTKVIKSPFKGFISIFLFDVFLCQKGIKNGIFHGPSFILPLLKKKDIRYVVTIHDLSFLIFKKNHSFIFNMYYKLGLWWSLKNADKIIAVSQNTKLDIIKYYSTESSKIDVIYLDGDKELIEYGNSVVRIIPEKYFFAISTHPKRKNIISILEAISRSSLLRNYTFVLAGKLDEKQLDEINTTINNLHLKNINLIGYLGKKDLASLYKYAEFFIYPSFYEGFGIPIVDALKLNCPVITSITSCMPEVVPIGYKFLVNPYSIDDIKEKMESLITLDKESRNELVNKNKKFSENFSWEKSAKKTINLYKNIYDESI